jgi:tetratricopeptide (TPR) repeat protein
MRCIASLFRVAAMRLVIVTCLGLLGLSAQAAEPTVFPKEARARFDLGQELRKQQRYRDAIAAFDEAIKLGMDRYPRVHLYRADALRELKSFQSAIAQYTDFIEKFGIEESCRY